MSTEDRLKNLIGNAGTEGRASEAEWNAFARKAHGALFTRRAATGLGAVAVIALAVFAGAALFGDAPREGSRPIAPAASHSAAPEPSATPSPATEGITIETSEQELWFVQGEKLMWSTTATGGGIAAESADDDPIAQKAAFWLKMLTSEVPSPVAESGGTTTIPEGTEVLHVKRDDATLFVDLSSEFESGGGSLSMQMRVAQVVYTATQFEGITAVRIMIEGEMVDSIGGEGVIVSTPLLRQDFEDLAPPVVVEDPRPNEELSGQVVISGFANVFEANVSIRLLDANGELVEEAFTTATCGSGCWGDYSHSLEFSVDEPQEGRLEVLIYSAEDGSPQNVISLPVMLVP